MNGKGGLNGESGQALLIGVLLFIVLLIAIPVTILFNKTSTQHGVMSQQKSKGRLAAEEAVAFGIQQLSLTSPVVFPTAAPGVTAPPGPVGLNDSSLEGQSTIPSRMFTGQRVPVSITFKNTTTGNTPWTPGAYRLLFYGANWTTPTGTTFVNLNAGESIDPGLTKTFYFLITAPTTAGTYQFQCSMQKMAAPAARFGAVSANVTVDVADQSPVTTLWPYVPGGSLPTAGAYSSIQGSSFTVTYTSAPYPGLQSYQIGILTRPQNLIGKNISGSAVFAEVSQKTVGVKLPNGLSASAAVQLKTPPSLDAASDFIVHWGPLALFVDTNLISTPFNLGTWMDVNQAPRKFSSGGIKGPTHNRSEPTSNPPTDQKEYWAYTDLGFPAPIDLAYYQEQAQKQTSILGAAGVATALPSGWLCDPVNTCIHQSNSGYFYVPPSSTMTITGAATGWSFITPDGVIYVDGGGIGGGNVIIQNVAIDFKDQGALIVTGNLTIGTRPNNSGLTSTVTNPPIPITADLEYPYSSAGDTCHTLAGQTCPMSAWAGSGCARPSIRGFVYVIGDMAVNDDSTRAMPCNSVNTRYTVIVGTLRVDGVLSTQANTTLAVYMDSTINHSIHTSNFELQIDSMTSTL